MSNQVGEDIALDVVDRQFEPYLTRRATGCICLLVAATAKARHRLVVCPGTRDAVPEQSWLLKLRRKPALKM